MRRLLPILLILLCSCRTIYIPGPSVHDTTVITQRDVQTVEIHDSTFIRETADTVYIYKERTAWRDRWRTDTIIRLRTDTVTVPVEMVVEVPRELNGWQRAMIGIGESVLAGFLLLIAFKFIKSRL